MVAKDQETVVIGGIMQDRRVESRLEGAAPGRHSAPRATCSARTARTKVKTNLLLFLTPYIIRDSSDFRRIFERKMNERQQFVEQFYGAATGYDVAIDFNAQARARWRA